MASETRIYRVSFESTVETTKCATVVHVKATPPDAVVTPSVDTVADNVVTWLSSAYRAMLSTRDRLDDIKIREELGPGGGVPAVAERTGTWPGTWFGSTYNQDLQICAWSKTKTDAAVRGGHGGFFSPPALDQATFSGSHGTISTGNAFYLAIRAFADALLNGHDMGLAGIDGHLSYVIYSKTRRFRSDPNWYFDAKSITIDSRPHMLRSRKS
jgi:hypothetical protein